MTTNIDLIRAQRIRELRKARKWSQEELGKRINAAKNSVYSWERDINPIPPNLDYVAAMANLFNVSADYLLGLTVVSSRVGEALKIEDVEADTLPLLRTGRVIDELVRRLAARDPDIVLLFSQEFSNDEIEMIYPTLQAVMKYREAMQKAKAARSTVPIAEDPEVGVEKRADSAG